MSPDLVVSAIMKYSLIASFFFGGFGICIASIEKVANIHPASQHLLAHSTDSHSIPSLEDVIDASPLLSYHRSIVQIESTTKNEAILLSDSSKLEDSMWRNSWF